MEICLTHQKVETQFFSNFTLQPCLIVSKPIHDMTSAPAGLVLQPEGQVEAPGENQGSLRFGRQPDILNRESESTSKLKTEASILMQRLSYPTETVLSKKVPRNRIVISFKDSPRKPLWRRPQTPFRPPPPILSSFCRQMAPLSGPRLPHARVGALLTPKMALMKKT